MDFEKLLRNESSSINGNICRVCHIGAQVNKPLYSPCKCMGTIKHVHENCLMQWLQYSKKDYCELCGYRFKLQLIYKSYMPFLTGLCHLVTSNFKLWSRCFLICMIWLIIAPLCTYRTYRHLFNKPTFKKLLVLPYDVISLDNMLKDTAYGSLLIISTVWLFTDILMLNKLILLNGGPKWWNKSWCQEITDFNNENGNNNNDDHDIDNDDDDNNYENENELNNDRNHIIKELVISRLFGANGYTTFITDVFFTISLNNIMILLFGFCPFYIGHFVLSKLSMWISSDLINKWPTIVISYFGFIIIGHILYIIFALARRFCKKPICKYIALMYTVVKVLILVVLAYGLIPAIFGWWIDICTLKISGVAIDDRLFDLTELPYSIIVIHFIIGNGFIFFYNKLQLIFRKIVKPDSKWFEHHPYDDSLQPIHDMIHKPIWYNIFGMIAPIIILSLFVLFIIGIPIYMLGILFPNHLPYNFSGKFIIDDSVIYPIFLHCILPKFTLPVLFKNTLRIKFLRLSCIFRSYLNELNNIYRNSYKSHALLTLWILCLLCYITVLIIILLILFVVIPIWIGRQLYAIDKISEANDFCTFISGLMFLSIFIKFGLFIINEILLNKPIIIKTVFNQISKVNIFQILLLIIIAFEMGLLVDLMIIMPYRIIENISVMKILYQDILVGIIFMKMIRKSILLGPDCYIKRWLQQIQRRQLLNMSITESCKCLFIPIITVLIIPLVLPYVIALEIIPYLNNPTINPSIVIIMAYPTFLLICILIIFVYLQLRQLMKFYNSVKRRNLIGLHLENYEASNLNMVDYVIG